VDRAEKNEMNKDGGALRAIALGGGRVGMHDA